MEEVFLSLLSFLVSPHDAKYAQFKHFFYSTLRARERERGNERVEKSAVYGFLKNFHRSM
jgi:hypothetical protein